ncbi:hypothetical protein, partial [Thiolapillus sp.]
MGQPVGVQVSPFAPDKVGGIRVDAPLTFNRQTTLSEIVSMQVSVESGEGLVKRLLVNLPADKV